LAIIKYFFFIPFSLREKVLEGRMREKFLPYPSPVPSRGHPLPKGEEDMKLFFLFINLFHRVHDFFSLIISAFGASFVRNNFGSAIGTLNQIFGFKLIENSGSVAPGFGVTLSGYWHKIIAKLGNYR
jgi:hypothetical protein